MRGVIAQGVRSAAVVVAALACSSAPVSARPAASAREAAAVKAVEHEWLTALQRHDVRTLARILGREFIDSDYLGSAITRKEYLSYFARPLAHAEPALEQRFEDVEVRFLAGGEVAIVTGVVVTRPARSPSAASRAASKVAEPLDSRDVRHSRFTDVFVWRDARWQAVSGQETHFSPAKG
jgi:ketosteroid isomerase-like protein